MRELLAAAALLCALTPSGARATDPIVEAPIAFEVTNVNDAVTSCPTDGATYTVRGTMAAPVGALEDSADDAVTLYVHGSGDNSSWNAQAFPAYDYLAAMARAGHVSVFVHTLGYGPSDDVDGNQVCFGSLATTFRDVVESLRAGTYDLGERAPVAFERVALAGHSGGGILVELYSVSFDNIDALAVVGWADHAPPMPSFYTGVGVALGVPCAQGGTAKREGGHGGWGARPSPEFIDAVSYNVQPAIRQALHDGWEGDPCGVGVDAGPALAASSALAPTVDVPVLLLYGDHDPWLGAQLDLQRARYTGSDDVSLSILPDTGHMMMMGNTLPAVTATMSGWLGARGF